MNFQYEPDMNREYNALSAFGRTGVKSTEKLTCYSRRGEMERCYYTVNSAVAYTLPRTETWPLYIFCYCKL